MNRPLLIIGLLVIAGMCLVPPREIEAENPYGDVTAEMLGVDETPSSLEATVVVYRPIGADPPERVDQGKEVQSSRLATTRLLLQIVVVAVVFGGLALIVGNSREERPAGD